MSGDLIDTTEMYLKTVFELREVGIAPMRARIAERLGHSGPTVSQTVARMERDGLLHLDSERIIRLTEEGRALATAVMRKHRLAERHLADDIGLDIALVHEEACRWEHVMSVEVERRLAAKLQPPYVDPYGNPIPGLGELGVEAAQDGSAPRGEGENGTTDATAPTSGSPEGKDPANRRRPLADLVAEHDVVDVRIERIGERAQSDGELLAELARQGLMPGGRARARRTGEHVLLERGGEQLVTVSDDAACQIVVTPIAAE